jgi:hypothetical protein
MTTPPLPEQIELHRDRMWRRDEDLRVESAVDAERFIEDVGVAKLRSLTPALSQWEREPYADRCPSRRSVVPTSRCAVGGMLVCPATESVPGAVATGSHDVWWRSRNPVAIAPGTDLITLVRKNRNNRKPDPK